MASDYSAARQEFVDRINAGVSLSVPFIQKRVNHGAKVLTEDARSNGIIELFVPAGGTGSVEALTSANGPVSGALDRSSDTSKANSSFYKVQCFARNAWELVQYGVLDKMFKIGKLKENIIQPRINHLVQNIEKDVVVRNWTKAAGACIAETSVAGFVALDKAMSILQVLKQEGSWTGYMSPLLKSMLSTGAAMKNGGFDVPDDVIKGMYGKHSIGTYGGADWVNEAFMPNFTCGALNKTDTANGAVTVSADVATQGASTIALAGLGANASIKKGTPFTIEGVYEATTAGIKVDLPKVFIVQEDATANGSGAVSVKVMPMYFNDDTKGYQNNLYATSSKIAENAVVKGLCTSGATYYVAFVKEDEAFNWTPFELPDVEGCNNTSSSTEDVSVQLVSGGTLLTRNNMMRMDSPYFGDICDERACRLIFVQAG